MATNAYTPPKADVKDVGPERALTERPRHVVYAVVLLWISLVLAIPAVYWEQQRSFAETVGVYWVMIVVLFGLSILVNVFIWRGSNWARILFLLLLVISLLSRLGTMEEMLSHPAIEIGVNLLMLAIEVIAAFLLFTKPGALWFRRAS